VECYASESDADCFTGTIKMCVIVDDA
jgi:hypothetical protein